METSDPTCFPRSGPRPTRDDYQPIVLLTRSNQDSPSMPMKKKTLAKMNAAMHIPSSEPSRMAPPLAIRHQILSGTIRTQTAYVEMAEPKSLRRNATRLSSDASIVGCGPESFQLLFRGRLWRQRRKSHGSERVSSSCGERKRSSNCSGHRKHRLASVTDDVKGTDPSLSRLS